LWCKELPDVVENLLGYTPISWSSLPREAMNSRNDQWISRTPEVGQFVGYQSMAIQNQNYISNAPPPPPPPSIQQRKRASKFEQQQQYVQPTSFGASNVCNVLFFLLFTFQSHLHPCFQ
jgi:hypothetical protein